MKSLSYWATIIGLALAFAGGCSRQGVGSNTGGAGGAGAGTGPDAPDGSMKPPPPDAGVESNLGSAGAPGGGNSSMGGRAGLAGGGTGSAGARNGLGDAGTGSGGMTAIDATIPAEWTCTVLGYANGTCDCGCGAPDPDCSSTDDIEVCESCNTYGGCNLGGCPGKIDRQDVSHCVQPPEGWTCLVEYYGDETSCECGCGIPDPDCADGSVGSCDNCYLSGGCGNGPCPSSIDQDDNASCEVPEGWTCLEFAYGNATCHCGCGVVDIDCASASQSECQDCSSGCSDESCPGPIDEENNAICTGVPATWSCNARFFGDGSLCHCGCGALDPDCAASELDACDRCNFEGSCSIQACPGTINPEDLGHCIQPPPPEDWVCEPSQYADSFNCDCGCGAFDLDCESQLPVSCGYCGPDSGGCADYECSNVDPEDNTRCTDSAPLTWVCSSAIYGDGACDCGCGALDVDCANSEESACDFCDAEGSCSEEECPGTIDLTDNAVCTE